VRVDDVRRSQYVRVFAEFFRIIDDKLSCPSFRFNPSSAANIFFPADMDDGGEKMSLQPGIDGVAPAFPITCAPSRFLRSSY